MMITPTHSAPRMQRSGYQRQHEFARAFRQHTGAAPTVWRAQPFMRSGTARER